MLDTQMVLTFTDITAHENCDQTGIKLNVNPELTTSGLSYENMESPLYCLDDSESLEYMFPYPRPAHSISLVSAAPILLHEFEVHGYPLGYVGKCLVFGSGGSSSGLFLEYKLAWQRIALFCMKRAYNSFISAKAAATPSYFFGMLNS